MSEEPEDRRVDRRQLVALVRANLAIGGRAMAVGRRSGSLKLVAGLYLLFGLLLGMGALANAPIFWWSLATLSMTFFVVVLAVVVESAHVLFDVQEADLLLHRPITSATLVAAKTCSLLGTGLVLALSLNFGSVAFGGFAREARWWFPLVHLASVVALVVFCCAAVVCAQTLVLRLVRRERFDDWVVWSQALLMVFFYAGPQLASRLLAGRGLDLESVPRWLVLYPPTWFAAIDSSLAGQTVPDGSLLAAALAPIATLLLVVVALPRLSRGYDQTMARLRESPPPRERARAAPRRGFLSPSRWLRDPVERASFRLVGAYFARDRDLRLVLFPMLASLVAPMIPALVSSGRAGAVVGALTLSAIMPAIAPIVLGAIATCSHPEAAQVFSTAPLANAGPLFHGARKAVLVWIVLPAIAVLAALAAAGGSGFENLMLALPSLMAVPASALGAGLDRHGWLPLATPIQRGSTSSAFLLTCLVAVFGGCALFGLGYAARHLGVFWPFLAVEAALLAALHVWLLRRTARLPMPRPG